MMFIQNVNGKKEQLILSIYLLTELVLFFLIKWAENTQEFFVYGKIEYTAIVINFLIMIYFYGRKKGDFRIPLALTVTLAADYFLTLMGNRFSLGVFLFFLVQLIYGWKLGYCKNNVLLRLLLFVVFGLTMELLGMDHSFSILCGLSISTLLGNVWVSVKNHRKNSSITGWLLMAGLILFAGCDLSLGLTMISQGIPEIVSLHNSASQMVWIFYVPSQVSLTLAYIFEEES